MTELSRDHHMSKHEHRPFIALAMLLKAGIVEKYRLKLVAFSNDGIELEEILIRPVYRPFHLLLEFSETATREFMGDVLMALNPPGEDTIIELQVWQHLGPNSLAVLDLSEVVPIGSDMRKAYRFLSPRFI